VRFLHPLVVWLGGVGEDPVAPAASADWARNGRGHGAPPETSWLLPGVAATYACSSAAAAKLEARRTERTGAACRSPALDQAQRRGRREGAATTTATPMSDPGVDVSTGEYGDQSTDVIRRCIECGELRLTRRRRM
jgi:hypothetical protein